MTDDFNWGNGDSAGDTVEVSICGETYKFPADASPKEALREKVQELGLSSITMSVDGETISGAGELPDSFGNHKISIDRYVKPGSK